MAPSFDAGQVLLFIKLLTGSETSSVSWQVFYDPKDQKRDDLAARFIATYAQAEQFIKQSQSNYCGVYIGINGTDGIGVENSIKILKNISREQSKSVFLISHKEEAKPRVNDITTVVFENGFSSIQ